MTKDEALKLASALDHWATQMDMGRKPDPKSLIRKASAELRRLQAELDAIKQALAAQHEPENEPYVSLASVQEPVATLFGSLPVYDTTPHAAPDLQAELAATNRQVEILSDALAESQRQRQWVGLTVLEQADCFANTEDATEFYHAIEAKLKEKNT
jgi:hypothetical protein